jgi:uncharacterized protein YjiS (DUF1127 family)
MSANPTARGTRATVSGRWRFIPFFFTQLSTAIQVWIERSRQRRELGELADRKDHLLADIGLSVEEARREAAKPFWAFSGGNHAEVARLSAPSRRFCINNSAHAGFTAQDASAPHSDKTALNMTRYLDA